MTFVNDAGVKQDHYFMRRSVTLLHSKSEVWCSCDLKGSSGEQDGKYFNG